MVRAQEQFSVHKADIIKKVEVLLGFKLCKSWRGKEILDIRIYGVSHIRVSPRCKTQKPLEELEIRPLR